MLIDGVLVLLTVSFHAFKWEAIFAGLSGKQSENVIRTEFCMLVLWFSIVSVNFFKRVHPTDRPTSKFKVKFYLNSVGSC